VSLQREARTIDTKSKKELFGPGKSSIFISNIISREISPPHPSHTPGQAISENGGALGKKSELVRVVLPLKLNLRDVLGWPS
jgi:hypothetical protein